ncbi:MAG: MBL fold metallo-hydrolase [Spirochaetes bacterium]|nr:MAG: MBL fold metallo-hydrolase [Spirochaetota bacterium]
MILEQIEVTGMAVYCYLVGDEKTGKGALIDPAGDLDLVFKFVERHGLKIEYVINTHGHWDHTSGNDECVRLTGAQILIHEEDAGQLGRLTSRILSRTLGGKGSPKPERLLHDGDTIAIGTLVMTVVHTPGHTPGGICLLCEDNIFTGDTLFTEGMGRTDLPGGSYGQIMESIRTRILTLPDDTKIWPGHNYGRFPVSTVKEQKGYYL